MICEKRSKSRIRAGIFIMVLLCALSFCTFSSGAASSSKKVALNKTSIKMTKGRTEKLRLLNAKGTVEWKSSKKSVAVVSKTGKITGVSAGTAKITAKYKGKTYRCTVKVYNTTRSYLPSVLKQKYTPSKNQEKIILAGSSSMEYWTSAASAFSPYKILNMGIAGTKVCHWEQLYTSLIVKYNPKAVVLYVGTNDIGEGMIRGIGAKTAANTRKLIQKIQKALPDTKIYYVSICPSIKRSDAWDEICICNKTMKAYCADQENLYYIDVASYMLKNGKPNSALYREDHLHLNDKGYKIWNKIIGSKVKKEMKE
ncbi:MAG: GDSL-type esterase/lipase family protein [Lachnospiraceae bacterium]|nr:GDSL-type esterase/lipase family protein [Lachnospiraceae bacterium]